MNLTIIDYLGKPIIIEVESSTTIKDLKIKLYRINNLINELVLYSNESDKKGVRLEDYNKTIEDYAINVTSIIKVSSTELLKIPEKLLCPLSMQIFLDPVTLPSGHTVE